MNLGFHSVVRNAKRVIVAVVGTTLILLGLALAILPGPWTIPLLLLGLAILATEFAWAARLLNRAKAHADRAKRAAQRKLQSRQRKKQTKLQRKSRALR